MCIQQKNQIFTVLVFIFTAATIFFFYYSIQNQYDQRLKQIGFVSEYKSNLKPFQNISNLAMNISTLAIDLKHFQLMEFTPIKNNEACEGGEFAIKKNSFLLINANTKTIGLKYLNLLKTLASQNKNQKSRQKLCTNFRIFLLKQKNLLLFDDEDVIQEYAHEIETVIYRISRITQNKFDIVSSQQGSILTLKTLSSFKKQEQFTEVIQKIDKIILINLYNSQSKLLEEPSFVYIAKIKRVIAQNRSKLEIFNSLNFIMINTLKDQYQAIHKSPSFTNQKTSNDQKPINALIGAKNNTQEYDMSNYFFVFENQKHSKLNSLQNQEQFNEIQRNGQFDSISLKQDFQILDQKYLSLNNTHFFHTREIFNLHMEINDGNQYIFQPFLKILSQFIKQNNSRDLKGQTIEFFWRYGETNSKFPFKFIDKIDAKKCIIHKLTVIQPAVWILQNPCFRLNIKATFNNSIFLLYSSSGNFDIYSNSMIKIEKYDKNLGGSLYMFEKIQQQLIIYNPKKIKIYIAAGQIFSPSLPLTTIFSQFQILYLSQVQNNKIQNNTKQFSKQEKENKQNSFNSQQSVQIGKFAVRTCSDNILIFPEDFAIGKGNRQFLLQNSSSECYEQEGIYYVFLSSLASNWIFFRNILFFTMFFIYAKEQPLSKNLITIFFVNYLILYDTNFKHYQNIILLLISFMLQHILNWFGSISKYISIDRKKIFFSMVLMFIVAFLCQAFLFHQFNYWKMLLIFVIFFINRQNLVIILIKIYFLKDYIAYGHYDYFQIIQMILLLQCNQKNLQQDCQKQRNAPRKRVFETLQEMSKVVLVILMGIALALNPHTGCFSALIDYYIRFKILINILERFY